MIDYPKQAIACVAGLCFAKHENKVLVQIQERWKPKRDPVYSGTIEIPVGVLDIEFEQLEIGVVREVFEETGLNILNIIQANQPHRNTFKLGEVITYQPYCVTQQIIGGKPWVCSAFICEVEHNEVLVPAPNENRNLRWVTLPELLILLETPDIFFPLTYPIIKKFVEEHL